MAGQPAVQPPVEAEPRLAGVAAEPSLPESSQPEVGQPEPDQSDPSPTLSKKQLKKQARRQHTEEAWVVKKKHQKEVRKEAKRTVRDSKQAAWEAMTEEDREDVRKEAVLERSVREASRAAEAAVDAAAGPTPICVIDLDFDELMDEQEVRSLVQQLMYSYGANKRARRPLRLHLTSLGGRIETQAAPARSPTGTGCNPLHPGCSPTHLGCRPMHHTRTCTPPFAAAPHRRDRALVGDETRGLVSGGLPA